jgi:hypothetical protein
LAAKYPPEKLAFILSQNQFFPQSAFTTNPAFSEHHFGHLLEVTLVTFCSAAVSLTMPEIVRLRGRVDRRRQSRVFVELPVQIWGMDANSRPFTQSASIRSISGNGATLQGVDVMLKRGDLLDVQYEGAKSQFRVVWLGRPGTEIEGEVGLESTSVETKLWDVDPRRCAAAVGQG